MQITEQAKEIIQKVLEEGDYNALELVTRACPCCGRAFSCAPVRASARTLRDETEEVGGIFVVMDETTRKQSIYVTIDGQGGDLIFRDDTPTLRIHGYQPFSF